MKRILRNHAAALFLLAPVTAALVMPATAAAQQRPVPAALQIHSLGLNADEGLSPGSNLDITVRGSPGGSASVRLSQTNIVVPLRHTGAGTYRGSYTVRRADRIDPTATLQARLTRGNKTVTREFSYPPAFQALAMGSAPQAAPAAPAPVPVAAVRIDRFSVQPVNRLEPGRELRFRLQGAPGAQATLEIPGVASGIAMREVSPGVYEGSYTIRQRDNPDAFDTAVATLRDGNAWVTSRIAQPFVRDREAPSIGNLTPGNGERVSAAGRTTISGTFDDDGRGVDPESVRLRIGGRDVTDAAQISPERFSYRGDLPPGRYTAEVSARDRAGNAVTRTWTFDVVGGNVGAAPGGPLPLHLSSPTNNATVDANGNVLIQGRTAPSATVRVRVDAVPPIVGTQFGVALQMADQTVQADRNGYFSLNVAPRGPVIPGSRYDVAVTANHGPQTAESRITLYQRG
jgi:hypothetical protein